MANPTETAYIGADRVARMTPQQRLFLKGAINRFGDEPETPDMRLERALLGEATTVGIVTGRPAAEEWNLEFFAIDFALRCIERSRPEINETGHIVADKTVALLSAS